jgi:hypothetical protein
MEVDTEMCNCEILCGVVGSELICDNLLCCLMYIVMIFWPITMLSGMNECMRDGP